MGNYSKLPKYIIKVNLFQSPLLLSVSQISVSPHRAPLPISPVYGGGREPPIPLKLWVPGGNHGSPVFPREGAIGCTGDR